MRRPSLEPRAEPPSSGAPTPDPRIRNGFGDHAGSISGSTHR